MAFIDEFNLAIDETFIRRVQIAAVNAAIALMAAPATDPRLANYCASLLNAPRMFAQNIAYGVAANPAITAETTDSDLQWTVNSIMSAYAGVLPKAT